MKLRITVLFIILSLLMICVGCDKKLPSDTSAQSSSQTPARGEEGTENAKYIYKTKYINVDFITNEDKEAWRDPLIKLLSNVKNPTYDKGGDHIGYTCPYPDQPAIEKGFQIALFDVNTDGTPELLVNAGGGSAGNAFYYVYDILTGTELGSIDGGHEGSWCTYFNHANGKYESIGQFEWRSGWMGKIRFVNKAAITQTTESGVFLHEVAWMTAYYDINTAVTEIPDGEGGTDYDFATEEIYPGVRFWVNESLASIDDYFAAQDYFTENYVRIAETGILLIDWNDITNEGDANTTKAEKMANALLSSDQQFVVPLQ